MKSIANKIDIIIPVYNNIELTIRCIKSIYQQLRNHINQVIIHDDFSSQKTNITLNKINNGTYSGLKIIRSEVNIGFAAGVNKACKFATAPYLFILNSDTYIQTDIIAPMLRILNSSEKIAAVNPSGSVFREKKLRRCQKHRTQPDKSGHVETYVKTAKLSGYALLIKTEIFESIGGFNPIYGRGYFEDTELSRTLICKGYDLAIYDTEDIAHIGQSSFNLIKPELPKSTSLASELMKQNEKVYLERFPEAGKTIDIYTFKSDFNKLPPSVQQVIVETTLNGGVATIYCLREPRNLPYFQIKYKKISFGNLMQLLLYKRVNKKKRQAKERVTC